ncbi:MAG: terpene cyclase/mutase family protein [Planctomycetes bacterium]|nr:terpene cyclase/mutase family protein [Planctomycetota bacterium]
MRKTHAFLAIVLLAAVGCTLRRSDDDVPVGRPGLSLPILDVTWLTNAGPHEPGAGERWLSKITVDLPVNAPPSVAGSQMVAQWRGVPFPRDEGMIAVPGKVEEVPEEIRVVVGENYFRMNQKQCARLEEVRMIIRDYKPLGTRFTIAADESVRFRRVLPVIAALAQEGAEINFAAPDTFRPGGTEEPDFVEVDVTIKRMAAAAGRDGEGLPLASIRIRAEADVPYGKVLRAMRSAVMARIWRITFCGIIPGRGEVEIGPVYTRPEEPAAAASSPMMEHVVPLETGLETEVIADVIISNEETTVEEAADEEKQKGDEDAISDIPLGGTGTVGVLGIGGGSGGGAFGYRTGGGRKRAVLRGGGSPATEQAVDAALAWLVRNQEEDGRWNAARHGGSGSDAFVTGLATLAFLGAGHTERTGRYKGNVLKAVDWMIKQQDKDGRIGDDGATHAACGTALCEAYGLARNGRTGKAAQAAADYSVNIHQVPYSGYGLQPKQDADTLVTAWFVQQLKAAKVVGLKVPGEGFQGATNWFDKVSVTDPKQDGFGSAGGRPGEAADSLSTAAVLLGRILMGWRTTDSVCVNAAGIVGHTPPAWGDENAGVDFVYWFMASHALFQVGGDSWKQWNDALRRTLPEHQLKTGDEEGSWDPAGTWSAEGGRAGSTALGALSLECYYRYLAMGK